MKFRQLVLPIALCVTAPSAVIAQEASNPSEQDGTSAAVEDDSQESTSEDAEKTKKVCKRVTNMGSRFSEKVCMTASQWEAERRANRDAMRDSRR